MRILEMPLKIVRQWIDLTSRTTADVSPADAARIYFDSDDDRLKVSLDGGSYSSIVTEGGAQTFTGAVTFSSTVTLGAVALSATAAQLNNVGAAFGSVTAARAVKVGRVALAALDTGGGVFAWQNPEASAILVQRVLIDITTATTDPGTIDIGTTAVAATTSSDNLLDGLDGNATGVFDNINESGSNGKSRQKLASGKWVTASMASGAMAGIAGFAYIEYVVI